MVLNIAVIGTIFIDCKGFAKQKYNALGRNLGDIKFVHGGVGRNVAENLAFLNIPIFFVSTVDDSVLGNEVIYRLRKANVDVDYLSAAKNKGMGMWMAVLNRRGDLVGSISQMPDLSLLEKLIEEKGQEVLERASHVVLELDLNESISRRVIEKARELKKPVYGIPGNLDVVMNNQYFLSCTDCFICNDIEAGRLFGYDLSNMGPNELIDALIRFSKGASVPTMVITLGARGSVYYDARSQIKGYQPAFNTDIIDSSGAGDAFFSGTIMGLTKKLPLSEAVILGTKMASWTIQVEENTCEYIPAKIKEEELFRKVLFPGK